MPATCGSMLFSDGERRLAPRAGHEAREDNREVQAMLNTISHPPLRLRSLPTNFPAEGAIRIDLEEGIPVFRASHTVQARIEALLSKQRGSELSSEETQELDRYEEIDDYLSLVNRVVRNMVQDQG